MAAGTITIYLHRARNGWQVHVYDDDAVGHDGDVRANAVDVADALGIVADVVVEMAGKPPARKRKRP